MNYNIFFASDKSQHSRLDLEKQQRDNPKTGTGWRGRPATLKSQPEEPSTHYKQQSPNQGFNYEKDNPKKPQVHHDDISQQERFFQELERDGLQIVPMPGDGNCVYRSIAHQLQQMDPKYNNFDYKIVKDVIFWHIKDNEDFFVNLIEDGKVDEYIAIQSREGAWAGVCELQSAGRAFKVNVHVYRGEDRSIKMNFEDSLGTIRLALFNNTHCDSLIPKPTSTSQLSMSKTASDTSDVQAHSSIVDDEELSNKEVKTDDTKLQTDNKEICEIIGESQ
eukprot:TRINITY_DN2471_c0_g1_i1.p1 TRINITY_DN2471_c0_g1~~TRINITY_DN2471_c0_g1_i1.p1  ORF type:complete len:277 (+),score=25.22 TRINITY_DN2471_c0_g1_i1:75-905(+)